MFWFFNVNDVCGFVCLGGGLVVCFWRGFCVGWLVIISFVEESVSREEEEDVYYCGCGFVL